MAELEEQKAFEGQMEESLDHQIEALRKIDEQEANLIESLKGQILSAMSGQADDLKISTDELKKIFEGIHGANEELLKANGVENFELFLKFLGLNEDIEFVKGANEIKLFGEAVDLKFPLGTNEETMERYRQIVAKIEAREDLKPYITAPLELIPYGPGRLEFFIEKDGEAVKYCANPDFVLRVDKEPDPEKMREWVKLSIRLRQMNNALKKRVHNDHRLNFEQKNAILSVNTVLETDSPIPERYRDIVKELDDLYEKISDLEHLCEERSLFDDENGIKVIEEVSLRYRNGYNYKFLTDNNNVHRLFSYHEGQKSYEAENNLETGRYKVTTSYNNEERKRVITEYNAEGRRVKESTYEYDEGDENNLRLTTVKRDNETDVYDDSGEDILYRTVASRDFGGYFERVYMVSKEGESFSTLKQMREKHPEMTADQYLDFLAKNLDSPEKLHIFFKNYVKYVYDNNSKNTNEDYQMTDHGETTDFWQTPQETVERMRINRMVGDCDDYAFLAEDILKRQGETAYVIYIPIDRNMGHAICVWIKERENGKYDAYSMGTFGLDKNGQRYREETNENAKDGYETVKEALNSLMPKYDEVGLGVESGGVDHRIQDTVKIMSIINGESNYKDIPLQILEFPNLVDAWIFR
jgi:hypothetical protein